MNKTNNNYQFFKSAVAFFFLFFLHGFAIGNGQQGISHNGFGLGEGGLLFSHTFAKPVLSAAILSELILTI